MAFKEVDSRYDGPNLETEVLEFWKEQDVFAKTLEETKDRPWFTFSEGPPTANGRPGIHHVLARTFKDVYPRYRTMRGYHVPRKAGWDTHGLPVEHEIEKELNIFDKKRIEDEVGIDEFTRRCRESVMRYIGEWEQMTERMGFWVNLDEAYYTLDNKYIESVWHLLKVIWDKGLIYQGHKVVPYDPRIGATLSSHEVSQGYKEIEDPSVYVRFRVADEANTSFLAWTTTPWTLPSNLALNVNPALDYDYVETDGEVLIMASALVASILGEAEYSVQKTVKGETLVGKHYERLFDYLEVDADICRVLAAEYVTVEDGTGIVHSAPAYGVDDYESCKAHGIPVVHAVGLDGHFLPEVTVAEGRFFKDADPLIIKDLEARGLMFRVKKYLHNYPHGWRTGDPLIYYAKSAWYIRTSDFRERMVDLNNTINWVPEHIKEGRFGKWLENNIDWALSRERFWGTPLPVWTDGEGDHMCIGSIAELESLTGRELSEVDLHRPAVDEITFVHPENGRTYSRVPEVIDCWFDSGAMSYAQWHYPFENKEVFEQSFPADYICEAIDQTRGWFYTLHAISTLVSDSVAYRNCVCLSHIVDQDGKKMSKSVGNIVNPYDVFDTIGADALRWYFLARIPPDGQKRISVDIVRDVASSFVNTFWNTYAFFVLYARLDDVDLSNHVAVEKRPEIDRWALALLDKTVRDTTHAMDNFDAKAAGESIESFVDQLSNWYVRRNRRRFWKSEAGEDKQSAYLTLYECLVTVHRLMAPFMPFVSEHVYQNLVRAQGDGELSVHMSEWPEPDAARQNDGLIEEFDVIQRLVSLGRAAREQSKVRVRQPLSRLLVRVPTDAAADAARKHSAQILEELNVRELEFIARDAELVTYRLKPNLPKIGKQLGKRIPAVRKALENADAGAIATAVAAGNDFTLELPDETLTFGPEDVLIETESAEGYSSAEEAGYLVALDTALDDDLVREGLAREMVRTIQDGRKQAGLEIADRIGLCIDGGGDVAAVLGEHRDYIMAETLADVWDDDVASAQHKEEKTVDGVSWTAAIRKL